MRPVHRVKFIVSLPRPEPDRQVSRGVRPSAETGSIASNAESAQASASMAVISLPSDNSSGCEPGRERVHGIRLRSATADPA